MADRYTRKDAEHCFDRLVEAIGGRRAKSATDVGGLRLDYEPIYGGVNVEEISNPGGGISHPFGSRRLKPAEFCHAVSLVEDAARYRAAKGTKGRSHSTKSKAQLNREIAAALKRTR